MKKRLIILAIIAVIPISIWLLLPAHNPETTIVTQNGSIGEKDLEWMRSITHKCAIEHNIPSMVIGLIKNGEVAAYINSGTMSRRSEEKVNPSTMFQIASLSKSFTGLIVNNLIAEGLLDANQTIDQYLPDDIPGSTKNKISDIALRDVLHHQAGLPWDAKLAKRVILGGPMYGDYSEEDLLKDLDLMEIDLERKGQFSYSNLGYAIIGYIAERVSGKSYEELLQKYVVDKYDLKNTTTIPDKGLLATPYRPEWRMIKTKPWEMGKLRAGGGVFSSVADLSKLMTLQIKAYQEFSDSSKNSPLVLTKDKRTSWSKAYYGYGLFENPSVVDSTTNSFWHTGDVDGYASVFSFIPKYEIGIVMLTSSGKSWMAPLDHALQKRLFETLEKEKLVTSY